MVTREQFLRALFGKTEGKYIEIRDIVTGIPVIQKFYKDIKSVVDYAYKGNCYIGVCPREIKSGKEKDIKTITALWVDLDIPVEAAKERVKDFPLPPSILVNSGRHTHLYWLLKEPESVQPNTKGVLKGLAEAVGGDHCFDLSRVLRLPGTKNFRYEDNPTDVEVVVFEPEIRYNLSDFDSYEVEVQKKSEEEVIFSDKTPKIAIEDLNVSGYVKDLILKGKQDGDKYGSRSEADYKVVYELVKSGHDDDSINAVFVHYPIGKKYREQGEGYLKYTIGKVREKLKDFKPIVPKKNANAVPLNIDSSHDAVEILAKEWKLIYCAGVFYRYIKGCYRETDNQIVKQWIVDLIGKGLRKGESEEIIYFLQAKVFIDPKDVNNTNLLNLRNGLFDLDTWTLSPHAPDNYSTIQLDINFDPEAKCELWLKTLREIFPCEEEKKKISMLQEFFGLCLSKETKYEKALLCVGEGSNGKSVILWVLQHMLKKENVSAIPLEKFDNSHYLVNLFGKLANISIETNAKSEVYDSIFKAVVTGDLIQADQKFKPAIHFNPFCKLVFATNNLPRVDDKSDAFFRRLLIVRFNRQFSEEEQNKNLKFQLLPELDGILIWSLEGLKRLKDRGFFQNTEEMKKEIEDYRRENNSVLVFVEEICELDRNAEISKSKLYSVFKKWCKINGFHPLGKLKFGKELKRQFNNRVSDSRVTNGDRIWVGIQFNERWNNEFVDFICWEGNIKAKDL